MTNDIDEMNLDGMLESAIVRKGALDHLKSLERSLSEKRMRERRRLLLFSYAAAACLLLVFAVDFKLSHDVRRAGYGFDPSAGQMGGSEITALMRERRIKEAVVKIDEAIPVVEERIKEEEASPTDPDYALQLRTDREELDFLKAVSHMRQGRYFKAKRELGSIVEGGGAFASEAKVLLDSI